MARDSMCLVCRLIGCCGRGIGSRIGDTTMGMGGTLGSSTDSCRVMGPLGFSATDMISSFE